MPGHRRKFSPQFKAVQMVISTGKPIAEVARDLGIHDGTLGNWVNAWRREHPEPDQPLSPVERARVKELEDENRRLRMENEFLESVYDRSRARGHRGGMRICGSRGRWRRRACGRSRVCHRRGQQSWDARRSLGALAASGVLAGGRCADAAVSRP
jgi:transposase